MADSSVHHGDIEPEEWSYALQKFSSKLKSHHFSADWVWKGIGFGAWHIVMDVESNLGLVDRSTLRCIGSILVKFLETA